MVSGMRVADLIGMEGIEKRFNMLHISTDEELEKLSNRSVSRSLHTLGRSIKCINRQNKWF